MTANKPSRERDRHPMESLLEKIRQQPREMVRANALIVLAIAKRSMWKRAPFPDDYVVRTDIVDLEQALRIDAPNLPTMYAYLLHTVRRFGLAEEGEI